MPDPLTTGMSPTGLLTQTIMPPAPMTMTDTFDFAPGSMLDEGMRMQLQRVYFDHFHPQWPMLHRETFESTMQPKLLMQAVITVGLWFASAPGSRDLAISLAVFQFKLHLILQAVFITIYPALRISRNAEPAMLRVKVPMPLMMWDGPAAQWFGMIPTDPELMDDQGDEELLIISRMCDKAVMMMDNKPLIPLLSWDRCLGMSIWCWCMKHTESDREFIENIKPFVLEPLKGTGVHYGPS
ncbi:hypothetical protein KNSL1_007947 [Colletotrichum chrysophilum]|nr:hypothetical protein KNSL1_007947 [Colletotrichum chrysophilum]